ELARAFARRWIARATGGPDDAQPALREEMADVLAYLLKLANYAGVDLETAYLEKMRRNQAREWPRPLATESEGA
ncbi:MAG: hypothetical protein D8M52_11245, partial [Chlorobi bacterium]|nr:hypothetical protein [Chlorobiota bacterium]NOG68722.1 DUF550 domain-containing protein [Chlorobiota bacterium]